MYMLYNDYIHDVVQPNIKEFNDFYNGERDDFKGRKYRNPYKEEYHFIVKSIEEQIKNNCCVFNLSTKADSNCTCYTLSDENDKRIDRTRRFLMLLLEKRIDYLYANIENRRVKNDYIKSVENYIYDVCNLINKNRNNLFFKDAYGYFSIVKTKYVLEEKFNLYCLYTGFFEEDVILCNFVLDIACCKNIIVDNRRSISLQNSYAFEYLSHYYKDFVKNICDTDKRICSIY